MIILKEICVQDFLSHKDTLIHLEEGDKILLDGVSGSGKSSILDALLWCLYGRGRVENRSLVRRGAKEAFVSVMLYDGKKYYDIRRLITIAGKHTVTVFEGEDPDILAEAGTGGIRDTEAYIVKLLGASYELFTNSVAYPQGNRESFVNASSSRRKDLLLEILKIADITEYSTKTKSLIAEKVSSLSSLTGKLEASVLLMEGYDLKILGLPHLFVREGVLEDQVKRSKADLVLAEQAKVKLDSIYSSVKDDEETLTKLKAKKWSSHKIDYTKALIDKAEEDIKNEAGVREKLRVATVHNDELSAIISDRPALRNYSGDIEAIERRIRKIIDDTLVCPAGDACPYSKLIGPELATLKKELEEKKKEADQQNIDVTNWERKVDAFGSRIDTSKLEVLLANAIEARLFLDRAKEVQEQEESLIEIERLEKALASAPTAEGIKEVAQSVIKYSEILNNVEKELATTRGEIKYLETLAEEIKRLEKECDETDKTILSIKEEVELLSDLRDALGTNGIQATAIDYLLPSLEDRVNEVLGQLSDFRVRLDTQRNSSSDSTIEGLFITIKNGGGEEFSYESYSGGEKLKITVAISEALAGLSKVGFRILDELFVGLDEESTDSFAVVLSQIQSRFSQMLCVSHLRQIKEMFEKRIITMKRDGISETSI